MALEHEGNDPSRRKVLTTVAAKIGCSGHVLLVQVKNAWVSRGKLAG